MKSRGFIVYPGKLTVADSFRIGCIGHIDAAVMRAVVAGVSESLRDLGVDNASPPEACLVERAKLTGEQSFQEHHP